MKRFEEDTLSDQALEKDELIIEGKNAVLEAIRSGRQIDRLYVLKESSDRGLSQVVEQAKKRGIIVVEADRKKLSLMSSTPSPQGVIAQCAAAKYYEIDDMLALAKEKGEKPFIIICDSLSDPHNLGAILRSADAAGAHGVIIPKHRSVSLNSTVAKVSAGAIEHVMVSKAVNLSGAIDELKEKGLWIYGADVEGEKEHFDTDFSGAVAVVIGSEGEGLGKLVKEKCDFLIKIPMRGKISSLNASVSAALIMYEVLRQRRGI